jgi:hypothetical protein
LCFTGSIELAAVVLLGLALHGYRRGERSISIGQLGSSVVAGVVMLVVLTPWVAFNYDRFDGRLVLTTELGQTLASSNNAETYYPGTDFGYQTVLPPKVEVTPAQAADEPVMDQIQRDNAIDYARSHWERLFVVLPLRVVWEWSLWRPSLVAQREVLMGFPAWTGGVQAVSTWILLALGAAGLWVLRRRRIAIWPLVVLLALATANGVAFTPSYRYRIGGIIALIILASFAIDRGMSLIHREGNRSSEVAVR